ncbi:hypothetical protein H0H81_003642 [Sphagnurus paluster]|uniref:Uncharacterized protein n=1 Tax=Sphagnurus paluster TaxID=117069 RepID=A0A9P7FST7_9AGAR|nr:hypothetical protein H0H81_003642 [Sphagnurus paluster]
MARTSSESRAATIRSDYSDTMGPQIRISHSSDSHSSGSRYAHHDHARLSPSVARHYEQPATQAQYYLTTTRGQPPQAAASEGSGQSPGIAPQSYRYNNSQHAAPYAPQPPHQHPATQYGRPHVAAPQVSGYDNNQGSMSSGGPQAHGYSHPQYGNAYPTQQPSQYMATTGPYSQPYTGAPAAGHFASQGAGSVTSQGHPYYAQPGDSSYHSQQPYHPTAPRHSSGSSQADNVTPFIPPERY